MKYRSIRTTYKVIFAAVCVAVLAGCSIGLSFTGASIPAEAKTVSIPTFPNNAVMVTPMLSSTFTEALQDKLSRQTSLAIVRENGDLHFEGEITGYGTAPSSISADEYAQTNRLTISVRVRYTNPYKEEESFDRTFSAYEEYPTSQLLQSVESSLIPTIVEKLVDDIFNAAFANW